MSELITEVNCETGEIIERLKSTEEQAQIDFVRAEEAARAQAEAEAAAKRASALAKLAALGLDEDDLKALGL